MNLTAAFDSRSTSSCFTEPTGRSPGLPCSDAADSSSCGTANALGLHDSGWIPVDSALFLNASGTPHSAGSDDASPLPRIPDFVTLALERDTFRASLAALTTELTWGARFSGYDVAVPALDSAAQRDCEGVHSPRDDGDIEAWSRSRGRADFAIATGVFGGAAFAMSEGDGVPDKPGKEDPGCKWEWQGKNDANGQPWFRCKVRYGAAECPRPCIPKENNLCGCPTTEELERYNNKPASGARSPSGPVDECAKSDCSCEFTMEIGAEGGKEAPEKGAVKIPADKEKAGVTACLEKRTACPEACKCPDLVVVCAPSVGDGITADEADMEAKRELALAVKAEESAGKDGKKEAGAKHRARATRLSLAAGKARSPGSLVYIISMKCEGTAPCVKK